MGQSEIVQVQAPLKASTELMFSFMVMHPGGGDQQRMPFELGVVLEPGQAGVAESDSVDRLGLGVLDFNKDLLPSLERYKIVRQRSQSPVSAMKDCLSALKQKSHIFYWLY